VSVGFVVSRAMEGFRKRQELHLLKKGRSNATSTSRHRAPMSESADDGALDDSASAATGFSAAPSLHPSMHSVAMSEACSELTIGAGDATEYWDFQHRAVTKKDLGHTCRECRKPFSRIGDPLTERRGARISSRYHAVCFSGFADPRSQVQSSHHQGKLKGTQLVAAPGEKATTKMRTGRHFEGGGTIRGIHKLKPAAGGSGGGMGGKHGAAMAIGSHGFGAASSKGKAQLPSPGGFTQAELHRHEEASEGGPSAMARFLQGGRGGGAAEPPDTEPAT
jgi:hypothetical protein